MRDYIRVVVFKFNKKAGDYNGVCLVFGMEKGKRNQELQYSTWYLRPAIHPYQNFYFSILISLSLAGLCLYIDVGSWYLYIHTSPKINIYTIIIRKTESGFIESLVLFY